MTETKPKRRWFRFSLRTMFVVVTLFGVAAGWVAYQLNWIRQRHEFVSARHSGQFAIGFVKAPWSLRLFGEKEAEFVVSVPKEDIGLARELFPEAIAINPNPSDFPAAFPLLRPGAN
jgi:hypothetical protein